MSNHLDGKQRHLKRESITNRIVRALLNPAHFSKWFTRSIYRIIGKDITNRGERVDIVYAENLAFDKMDMYQKSHYRRYEFACKMLSSGAVVGDMACGTGYGTVMMSKVAKRVHGYDISSVINFVRERYAEMTNIIFTQTDLLAIDAPEYFDVIVSFETLEHFTPTLVPRLLQKFHGMLKKTGALIISTPYDQEETEASRVHHRSFNITEDKLDKWITNSGFKREKLFYQNYATHEIDEQLKAKDFMVAICRKR
jgi:2-polyprenyl-3-methyl-5-hydroxy-6-metoxy-1,4-benzoquinol methylase